MRPLPSRVAPPGRGRTLRGSFPTSQEQSKLLGLALLPLVLISCHGAPRAPAEGGKDELFRDFTAQSGLDFTHFNGMSGELFFNEVLGAGAALIDYDDDGDLDLYLMQGKMLGARKTLADALFPPTPGVPLTDRLYRNDLQAGGGLRFVDVTETSGLTAGGYGMGVATGDFDNDGWPDLYVANYGANELWRNRGRGEDGHIVFEDVTASSGAGDDRWSTSCAVLDFDRDGWLDLYITNYVDFRLENHRHCRSPSSRRDYCGPQNYNGVPDRLLRNLGAGPGDIRFEDVTLSSGIGSEAGSGLGVVSADFDGDGFLDLYVANDLMRNLLWRNRGDGSFENVALASGTAVNSSGAAEASMGLAAADFDQDGDEDLFMTHLRGETNTAFRNEGGDFLDASLAMGLAVASRPLTGFGVGVLDLEGDGDLDLAVANGDVLVIEDQAMKGEPFPLRQPNQLFRNLGDGRFEEVPREKAGSAFEALEVSRGIAVGDLDNDGDEDLVLTNNNGPARILIHRAEGFEAWLGLRLKSAGRDALGAEVSLRFADGSEQIRRARTDGSYGSARDPRVLFGLSSSSAVELIEVRWPDGTAETWPPLELGRYHALEQGSGRSSADRE